MGKTLSGFEQHRETLRKALRHEYLIMRNKCYSPTTTAYKKCGAKGIKICDEWLNDFWSFYVWSLKNGFRVGMKLVRLYTNRDYEPSNCKWTDDLSVYEQVTDCEQIYNRLKSVWAGMKSRCFNPDNLAYKHYGGRGITVCEEWLDFEKFYLWAIINGYDGTAPKGQYTIDRIDVNGNYEPKNCRWVDMKVQANNKRKKCRLRTSI